jgi:hypothetical protein
MGGVWVGGGVGGLIFLLHAHSPNRGSLINNLLRLLIECPVSFVSSPSE